MTGSYLTTAPTREEIETTSGSLILQFGTDWCEYCQAAEPIIAVAHSNFEYLRRLKIEDGQGRILGRSFKIKLWPTLIFLKNGIEISRVVRPSTVLELEEELAKLK